MTGRPIQLLLSQTDLPARDSVAPILAAYVQEAQTPAETAELEAIVVGQGKPGEGVTVVSRNLRNAIINWKELIMVGVPTMAATIEAYQANPYVGILAAFTALWVWNGLFNIKLSDAHAAVVLALWVDWPADKPVTVGELRQKLGGPGGKEVASLLDDLASWSLIEFDADDHIIRRDRLVFK